MNGVFGTAAFFAAGLVALFVLRLILATIVFLAILPDNEDCPICNAPTLRLQRRVWRFVSPALRPSWCPECGWEGLLRRRPAARASRAAHSAPRSFYPHDDSTRAR